MSEDRVQRRLAAILAADVVGYSRLMGRDEVRTLARLKALRAEVFDPETAQYGGRIFKNTGDGALAEFPSAVDAVLSAIEVQRAMAKRNADAPEDDRVELRIGISLGDVIVEGDDLFGNGVNIAARMEGLAPPGGICVSGNVHEHLHAAVDFAFDDLGEQDVKNIERPVHAYGVAIGSRRSVSASATVMDEVFRRPAVAVLPFDNLTRDPEQEYFSDGLTEDIITALSLCRTFPVIARNSTFTYKGRAVKVQEVAEELGARYVIEGSVRKGGDRVRIAVQLIDAESGHHVWAERYDRKLDDIFDLQDEITERIATTVAPELERAERQRSSAKPPSGLQAWDFYLRGMSLLQKFSDDDIARARDMFEQAIALDAAYSRGHAGLAYTHYRDAIFVVVEDQEQSIAKCLEAARTAVSLDDTDAFAHFVLSRGLHQAGRIEQALLAAKLALELNPNDAANHASVGILLISAGEPDDGFDGLSRALQLSPKDPRTHLFLSMQSSSRFVAGRYDEAVRLAKDALNRQPGDPAARVLLAASLACAGDLEQARAVLDDGEALDPAYLHRHWVVQWLAQSDRERILDGIRKAGWEG